MTYEEAVAYVGDRSPYGLVTKLRADGHDHPAFLAEALGISQEGGMTKVAFRIHSQVIGNLCDDCGVRPVDYIDGDMNVCDECYATYVYQLEDDL